MNRVYLVFGRREHYRVNFLKCFGIEDVANIFMDDAKLGTIDLLRKRKEAKANV